MHRPMICILLLPLAGAAAEPARVDISGRQSDYLQSYVERKLRQGPKPRSWVDAERWCVAHACLARG